MKRNRKINALYALGLMAFGATLTLTSCCAIDEDLSVCLDEYDAQYELRLITNEEPEIKRVLGDRDDMSQALRQHLANVFTDSGHDLHLTFTPTAIVGADGITVYTPDDTIATKTQLHDMQGNSIYTCHISLTPANYFHIATANHGAAPSAPVPEAPLYTGRKTLDGRQYGRYSYYMPLYVTRSAAAIAIDPRMVPITDVKVFTTGCASRFEVADSIFIYENSPMVAAERVSLPDTTAWQLYCATSYPSPEPAVIPTTNTGRDPYEFDITRFRRDIDEPYFIYMDCGENLWSYEGYVTLADGTITHTTIAIRHPLRAGQLKIIRAYIDDQGVIRLYDQELGESVDLKWEQGREFPIII